MAAESLASQQIQIPLALRPTEPFSLRNFLPHSGVIAAREVLEARVSEVSTSPSVFRTIYVYGPTGSGKTHLLTAFSDEAKAQGLESHSVCVIDARFEEAPETELQKSSEKFLEQSQLVSNYDRLKTNGGLLLVSGALPPKQLVSNPHLQSRLMAGDVLQLSYPREEELKPLLNALSERFNLKLSEKCARYVLERSATDPLSFSRILATIDEFSLTQSKKKAASLSVVREALRRP